MILKSQLTVGDLTFDLITADNESNETVILLHGLARMLFLTGSTETAKRMEQIEFSIKTKIILLKHWNLL